jgi:hypothetical protein
MRLIEVVRDLDSFNQEHTIYAAEPRTCGSNTFVAPESDAQELTYFLEVFVARELLEGWTASLQTKPTLAEKCARLIKYAAHDA